MLGVACTALLGSPANVLVNISNEAHDFHIHQTEFYVLPQTPPASNATAVPTTSAIALAGRATALPQGCFLQPFTVLYSYLSS